MGDEFARAAEPPTAGHELAAGAQLRPDRAHVGPAAPAVATSPATRHEHEHHVIAGFEITHAGADLGNDAGALVAGNGRQGARPAVVDGREIRVAQAGALDLHQHFALAGAVEVDGLEAERPALGIGTRQSLLVENRGGHFHGVHRCVEAISILLFGQAADTGGAFRRTR
jgi:hypothetical protein